MGGQETQNLFGAGKLQFNRSIASKAILLFALLSAAKASGGVPGTPSADGTPLIVTAEIAKLLKLGDALYELDLATSKMTLFKLGQAHKIKVAAVPLLDHFLELKIENNVYRYPQ